jgi:hypothetical protein
MTRSCRCGAGAAVYNQASPDSIIPVDKLSYILTSPEKIFGESRKANGQVRRSANIVATGLAGSSATEDDRTRKRICRPPPRGLVAERNLVRAWFHLSGRMLT